MGTIAIESPRLSAILSMVSIVFFVGNSAKMSMYPGIKRMNGSPKIMRIVFSISIKTTGSKIMLHIMQMMISAGYLVDEIFIVSYSALDIKKCLLSFVKLLL